MYRAANLVSETCRTKGEKKRKEQKAQKRMTGLANNRDPSIWSLLPVLKPVNTRCFIQYNWRNFKCGDCSPDFKNRKPPCNSPERQQETARGCQGWSTSADVAVTKSEEMALQRFYYVLPKCSFIKELKWLRFGKRNRKIWWNTKKNTKKQQRRMCTTILRKDGGSWWKIKNQAQTQTGTQNRWTEIRREYVIDGGDKEV